MIDWGAWLLCQPPAILLVVAAWSMRRQSGSWSAPGPMFAATWSVLVWIALLFAPDYRVEGLAVWVILAATLAVHLGGLLGESLWARTPGIAAITFDQLPGGRLLTVLGTGAGLLAVAYMLSSLGESLASFTSPTELALLAGRMSVRRYEESYVEPLVTRVLMAGPYFAALMGGAWAGAQRGGRTPRWVWLPFIPAVALAAATTIRAVLLYVACLWIGAWIASAAYAGRDLRRLITPRTIRLGVIALPLIVGVTTLLQLMRYGAGWTVLALLDRLRIWFFGYLAGFSGWLEQGSVQDLGTGGGAYTLAGAYTLLGVATRSMGIFSDRVTIALGVETNIFTAFRGLLQDFGVIGAAVALVTLGALAGGAHGALRRGHLAVLPIMAIFYALTLWSYITSLFNYNSIVLAWLCCLAYFPAARAYARLAPAHLPA